MTCRICVPATSLKNDAHFVYTTRRINIGDWMDEWINIFLEKRKFFWRMRLHIAMFLHYMYLASHESICTNLNLVNTGRLHLTNKIDLYCSNFVILYFLESRVIMQKLRLYRGDMLFKEVLEQCWNIQFYSIPEHLIKSRCRLYYVPYGVLPLFTFFGSWRYVEFIFLLWLLFSTKLIYFSLRIRCFLRLPLATKWIYWVLSPPKSSFVLTLS